jgi:homocysteine S-methyltransferase
MANLLDELRPGGLLPADCDPGVPLSDLRPGAWPAGLVLSDPEIVVQAHRLSVETGARLLRTNTWGADPAAIIREGLAGRTAELHWTASRLAVRAAESLNAGPVPFVAGWLSPARLPMEADERRKDYRVRMGALLDGGADAMLFDGFDDIELLLPAISIFQNLTSDPAIALLPASTGAASLAAAWNRLRREAVDILGVSGPFDKCLACIKNAAQPDDLIAAYLDAVFPLDAETMSALADAGVALAGIARQASDGSPPGS